MKATAEHAEAERCAARESVEERLFLDWIALDSIDVAVRDAQCSLAIQSDPAGTSVTSRNWTTMAACKTSDPISIQRFEQFAAPCVIRKGPGVYHTGRLSEF